MPTIKTITIAAQAAPFSIGAPTGSMLVSTFFGTATTLLMTFVKSDSAEVRPLIFVPLTDGSAFPSIGVPTNATVVASAKHPTTNAPWVLLQIKPIAFDLISGMSAGDVAALEASLGITIPQFVWDQTKWLASI